MNKEEKLKILNKTISKLKKDTPNISLGFGEIPPVEYIPTPFPTINELLKYEDKCYGIPKGKFTIIAGPQQTGKTTFCEQVIGYNMQQNPDFITLWTDAENAIDPIWSKTLGVDLDRLIVHKLSEEHPHMESLLDIGIELLKTGTIDMWVIDSIGGLIPKAELNKSVEDNKMLDLQRKLGEFLRKANMLIAPTASWGGTACVLIGQVYGVPSTTGAGIEEVRGGNAVKHWAYLRIKTRRGNKDEVNGKLSDIIMPDGNTKKLLPGWAQHFKIDKTKINDKENHEVILQFIPSKGFDSINATITALFAQNIIERTGGWYKNDLFPEGKIQGKEGVIEYLTNNEDIRNKLIEQLDNKLSVLTTTEKEENG